MAGSSGKKKGSPEYEDTHARIALAALNLLTESGIQGCDVRSVADAAHVSTATLRAHYPGGKGQLLLAAVEQMPAFTAADPLTGSARQRVDAYVTSAMQFAPRIAALLGEATMHSGEYPEFSAAVRKLMRDRREAISVFLTRLGADARPDASPDVLLWIATGTVQAEVLGDELTPSARRKLITEACARLILI